jgi:hypothetical protein
MDLGGAARRQPAANPNNLGDTVQIPGIGKQLDYSTSLIFDTPSFRNGVQISDSSTA